MDREQRNIERTALSKLIIKKIPSIIVIGGIFILKIAP